MLSKKVCIIAPGPSLTKRDCAKVFNSSVETICVNNAWKYAHWCDYLFASDFKYWNHYESELETLKKNNSVVQFWTSSKRARDTYGINLFPRNLSAICSGAEAVKFAVEKGAEKVVLLGFDCSVKHGVHFDGDHERPLFNPDEAACERFKQMFARINISSVDVVNCSRYSELECFRRGNLEQELC